MLFNFFFEELSTINIIQGSLFRADLLVIYYSLLHIIRAKQMNYNFEEALEKCVQKIMPNYFLLFVRVSNIF